MSSGPVHRSLPERPNLRHLKDQAKDLLRSGQAKSLADAQYQVACEYGFASWPKLKRHVDSLEEVGQLKAAIDANDLSRVQEMMSRNPALHCAPLGYKQSGPLTWAAECRGAAPTSERLAIARWMIENGSDVHQGGDGPLMRAALNDDRMPMMELLLAYGADVDALILAPCETLQPAALRLLIAHGADMHARSSSGTNCVQMIIGTYWRNPQGKRECLKVFADAGFEFPETAPMAIHRGRTDLLAAAIDRDPALLSRHFTLEEFYPNELGLSPGDGLHVAPLAGATLLHMAVEYHEEEIARWLIDRGADVNARSAIDSDGFGGHTPLFHTTVTLLLKEDRIARLLLRSGADPNVRATFRKQLSWGGDPEKEQMREYRHVTPIGFARMFQEPSWVNGAAIEAIREHGGR